MLSIICNKIALLLKKFHYLRRVLIPNEFVQFFGLKLYSDLPNNFLLIFVQNGVLHTKLHNINLYIINNQ